MRKRPHVIVRGTPREAAQHASGYAANAESIHTRTVARPEGRSLCGVDTVQDLQRRLQRAKSRHGNHRDPVVRRRAGEDMRELQSELRRLGYDV